MCLVECAEYWDPRQQPKRRPDSPDDQSKALRRADDQRLGELTFGLAHEAQPSS